MGFFSVLRIFPTEVRDVTKTGNGEQGTENEQRATGNGRTAATPLRIQKGGGKDVYKR